MSGILQSKFAFVISLSAVQRVSYVYCMLLAGWLQIQVGNSICDLDADASSPYLATLAQSLSALSFDIGDDLAEP